MSTTLWNKVRPQRADAQRANRRRAPRQRAGAPSVMAGLEPLEHRLALAAVLDVTPLTWDIVGLDSNKPVTSGPDTFLVAARIANTGDQAISGVQATLNLGDTVRLNADDQWATIADDYITTVGPTTLDSTFTIAPGEFVDAYFSIRIDRTSDAFTTARRYDITATDGVISDSLDATHQLYVEQLVSQNRNATSAIEVLSGGSPVTAAMPGDVLTIVHLSQSAPGGYEQTANALTLPTDVFEVLSSSSQTVETVFGTDSTTRVDSPASGVYLDAAGWHSDPGVLALDPAYNTTTDNQKAGGVMETTYQVRVRPAAPVGAVTLTGVIYDFSGSSFHYNADSGVVFKTLQITGGTGVSGRVWRDVNANNRQDSSEPGVLGVVVELRDAATGVVVATKVTNQNGDYLFSESDGVTLNTSYVVHVVQPAGTAFVRQDAPGSNDTNDSDVSETTGQTAPFTLTSGSPLLENLDAGLSFAPAEISGYTWSDINGDGLQDATEVAIDAFVQLFQVVDGQASRVATFETVASGRDAGLYSFTGLAPGDYFVRIVPSDPALALTNVDVGSDDLLDSDVDPFTNDSAVFQVAVGETHAVDAGVVSAAVVMGTVWNDDDVDGLFEGEAGVRGVTVELLDANGGVLQSTVTGTDGSYLFESVPPSIGAGYAIRVVPATGYGIAPADVGGDDAVDSDVSVASGETVLFAVAPGSTTVLDAGIYLAPPDAVDDDRTTPVDTPIDIAMLGNDVFARLKTIAFTQPVDPDCSVTLDDNGTPLDPTDDSFVFTPVNGFTGVSTFTYTLTNSEGEADTAVVTVTVGTAAATVADLLITKTDGQATAIPGTAITYTIVVGNSGPADVVGATIDDAIPAVISGVTWTASYSAGSGGAASGVGSLVAEPIDLLTGGSATFVVTGMLAADATGTLVNTATVTPPTGFTDGDLTNNSATDSTSLVPTVNLRVTKDDGVTTVSAGGTADYTIIVTNDGPSVVTGAVVSDVLPAGISYVSATNGATYDAGTRTVSYTSGLLTPTATESFVVSVAVAATFPAGQGSITNTATVAAPAGVTESDATDNADSDTNTLDAAPDLTLTKSSSVTSVSAGDSVNYVLAYANVGTQDATGVEISDTLPTGMSFDPVSNTGWTLTGSTLSYTVGNLVAGGSGSVNLVLVSDATFAAGQATIENVASVADDGTNGADPTPTNNTDDEVDTLDAAPDLTLTKSSSVTSISAGDSVNYVLTYENVGTQDATGVEISDTLPVGMSFDPATNAGWTLNGSTLTYTVGNMAAGGSGSVNLVLVADATFAAGQATIENVASVADDGTNGADPTPTNNTDDEVDTLDATPDLTLTKSSTVTSVSAGESVTYVLAYANVGTQDATGVEISDTLPAGMSFDPAANAGWTLSGSTLTYTVGNLAAGASGSVNLLLVADATFAAGQATIENVASVGDDGTNGADPTPTNNTDDESDTLDAAPDLTLTKSSTVTSISAGDSVTYELAYANVGTQDATGVEISDTLPTGMSFDPAVNTGWTLSGSTLSYTVGSLAAGASGSVNLVLVADATFAAGQATIDNVASVGDDGTNGADPTPTNNTDDESDTLDAAPDLTLTKSSTVTSISAGDSVTYVLAYANVGTQDATGVEISDTLPVGMSFDPAVNTGWTLSGSTLTYTVGNLAAGGSGSVNLVLVADATFAAGQATIENVASVADDGTNGADPTPTNNTDDESDTLDATPDLTLTKSSTVTSISAGDSVNYVLAYENVGTQDATGVEISDTLPVGMSFDPALNAGWTLSGSTLSYTVGNLAAGGSGSVNLVLVADATFAAGQATIENVASVADDGTNGADPTPTNNTDDESDTLDAAPDLVLTKSSTVTSISAGDSVNYVLAYANVGTQDATGVEISDTLPTGMSFDPVSNTGWTLTGSTLSYTVGNLVAGGSGSVNLVLVADATFAAGQATIENVASVGDDGTNGADPTPTNNTDDESDTLDATPDLTLTKSSSVTSVSAGDSVNYVLAYANVGTQDATGVEISDTLPTGMSFDPASNAGWTLNGSTLSYTVGNLTAGGSGSVNLVLVADATFAAGQATIENVASVGDDGTNGADPTPTNNTDDESDTLDATPDLTLTKSSTVTSISAGDSVNYVLAYANVGTQDATGVEISDTLPTGMSFDPAANAGWTLSGSTLTYTVGNLAAGASGSVNLLLVADASFAVGHVTIENIASVADDGTNGADPNPADNTDSETDAVSAAPDLAVTKTDHQDTAIPGTAITYTIVVSNLGTRDVRGASIEDLVPDTLTDVSWTATYSAGSSGPTSAAVNLVGIVEEIDLLAGGTATFTLNGTISPAATGTLSNTVTVSVGSGVADSDPSNNSATDTTLLTPTGDLSITKTSEQQLVVGGDSISYTITVANTGPSDAVGARLTDELTADLESFTWIASYSDGSTGALSGSGPLVDEPLTLRAGGTATFTLTGVVAATASDTVVNTASIGPPVGFSDPDTSNNSASETTAVEDEVDLAISINDGRENYLAGSDAVYTVIVTNTGPGSAVNAEVLVTLPAGLPSAAWSATLSPGSLGANSGVSNGTAGIDTFVTLLPGGSAIYTLRGLVADDSVGPLTTSATVTASASNTEPNLTNNAASDTGARPLLAVGTNIDCESEPMVTILDPATGGIVSQFMAFEPGFRGGVRTALADVDGDQIPEVVAAAGMGRVGEVRVFDLAGNELTQLRFQPYGSRFQAGVSIATDDVDGDGIDELITGQSRGSGRVQVFRGLATGTGWESEPFRSFDPYGPRHINGVNVAGADVGTFANGLAVDAQTADGRHEIAVTSGPGSVQPAKLFDVSATPTLIREITGEPLDTTGGATVSSGRYDSDSVDDLFISGGVGSGSVTAIYSGRTDLSSSAALQRFAAFADLGSGAAPVFSTGVDLTGDGRIDQIYSLQGSESSTGTRVFDPSGQLTETVTTLRGTLARAALSHEPGEVSFGPNIVPLVTTASGLQYRDLVVGTGAEATPGKTLEVHYVGSRQNGDVFDSSRPRGAPFQFTLGAGQVIAGWDEGLAGMREGSRRTLYIPANLAYGDNPPGSVIQPGDTLVFDVELLSVS